MVIGVTLVKVATGFERRVFSALQAMPGLKDLYHLFGEYDFLVITEVETLPILSAAVDKIRAIEGVKTTRTVVGAEVQGA